MIATPVPFGCSTQGSVCVAVQVPGPPGNDGQDGINGSNGVSAFTILATQFVMPNVGDTVIANVQDTSWMVPTIGFGTPGQINGQILAVQFAGWMMVVGVLDATHVLLANLGYPNTAPAGTVIPPGARIGVAGMQGNTGSSGGGSGLRVGIGPPMGAPTGFNQWVDSNTDSYYYWNDITLDWRPLVIGP